MKRELTTNVPANDVPDKIYVNGEIQLGVELDLIRELHKKENESKTVVRLRGPFRIPEWRRRPPVDFDGMGVKTDRIEYRLEPVERADSSLFIEDMGMCQTYGIFGVPGCGKTYLLMHLLRQLVDHKSNQSEKPDPERKFGMLILDPKGALQSDVTKIVEACGRGDDLFVLNENEMRAGKPAVNIIDSYLEPVNLGQALSMAAQSAGITSREPYWMNSLARIFGAAAEVLNLMQPYYKRKPTLARLVDMLLGVTRLPEPASNVREHLRFAEHFVNEWCKLKRDRFEVARDTLERFEASKDHETLRDFIDQAYGAFRRPEYKMFSADLAPGTAGTNLYDQVVDDGKILLVSISKRNIAISKIVSTVVKTLFQQTVLTRRERFISRELKAFVRPLLFMADEYSDVATELEGQPMGDGLFFSQMRQFGCMGLVATQSIHMLQNSALGDTWRGIFANMAAKIFMQLGDAETADEASKLVGESEYRFQTFDRSYSKDGTSQSVRFDLKDKKDLPTRLVLQTLGQGQAVVVGSIDGKARPSSRFIHVNKRS